MSTPRFFDQNGKEIVYQNVENFTEVGECRRCGKIAGLDIFPAFKGCCEECKQRGIDEHLERISNEAAEWMERSRAKRIAEQN